jgi:integrase
MARTVLDSRLDSRTARARLTVRHEPYWRAIDSGMHIGYRKGVRKTAWVARHRSAAGRYTKTVLGIADDVQDADGDAILSFSDAQARAREWFAQQSRGDAGGSGRVKTVADAVDLYRDWYVATRPADRTHALRNIDHRIAAFILPELGAVPIAKLTTGRIRAWLHDLSDRPPRVRSRPGTQRYRDTSGDPYAVRKRRATANKVLTILKAALNHAYHEGLIASDDAWRRVKPFAGVNAARVRYLSAEESVRLVNACDEDFRRLVEAGLHSGCRYGELTRLRVRDYIADSGTVLIEESKNGKPRHVVLTEEGQDFFCSVAAGKHNEDILFTRADGGQWGASHQNRRLAAACENGRISPAINFHVLRHSYASRLVMAAIPLPVVSANLGHADTRMVEKHYGHLAPSYVADTIRKLAPNLGLGSHGNVEVLKSKDRA